MSYYFNLRIENGNVDMWVFITLCTYLSSGLGSRGGAGPTGPWFMGSNPAPERITESFSNSGVKRKYNRSVAKIIFAMMLL